MGSREQKTHLKNDREEDEIEAKEKNTSSQRMDGGGGKRCVGGYNPNEWSHVALAGEENSVSP